MEDYPFFQVEKIPETKTAILYFNRPEKLNAMNWPFWQDLPQVIDELEADSEVRVVVIAGRGKSFSVGIDVFEFFTNHQNALTGATADAREELYRLILRMQEGFDRMTAGNNIYIAAIHRHCIGAGLDISAACDLRLAARDALFSLRETQDRHRGRHGQPQPPPPDHRPGKYPDDGLHRPGFHGGRGAADGAHQ